MKIREGVEFATSLPENGPTAPREIVYIPEGEHRITPNVNGKPGVVTVKVRPENGPAIANLFNQRLQELRSGSVRPIIDFDHAHRGPAAGIPQAFSYVVGKGITLAVEWTGAGEKAITERNFSYFSPEFLLDDDGTPGGLPSHGPIGSLVNSPAFRVASMQVAAAAESVDEEIERRALALVAAGQASNIDAAISQVIASDPGAYDRYLENLANPNASRIQAARPLGGEGDLEIRAGRLVAAGRAQSLNDAISLICMSDPGAYEAYLDQVAASGNHQPIGGAGSLSDRARSIVAAGEAKSEFEAMELICSRDPEAYPQYLASLR